MRENRCGSCPRARAELNAMLARLAKSKSAAVRHFAAVLLLDDGRDQRTVKRPREVRPRAA